MKPMNSIIKLKIVKSNGGIWRFKIRLIAHLPKVDDMIFIRSPINQTRSVEFKLTNFEEKTAIFRTHFTSVSDPEFTIMPRQGILAPFGKEGTTFCVSFTPISYGKER